MDGHDKNSRSVSSDIANEISWENSVFRVRHNNNNNNHHNYTKTEIVTYYYETLQTSRDSIINS